MKKKRKRKRKKTVQKIKKMRVFRKTFLFRYRLPYHGFKNPLI